MRTRQFVDGVFGAVHVYDPSSGVVAIMSAQDEPLLIEYSIRTLPLVPEDVHVMFCVLATCHVSPPLGAVTVIAGIAEIVNTALL